MWIGVVMMVLVSNSLFYLYDIQIMINRGLRLGNYYTTHAIIWRQLFIHAALYGPKIGEFVSFRHFHADIIHT